MSDINHKKSDVLSHAECPRDGSRDVEAIWCAGDDYKLRCNYCGNVWTERHPGMN
jgi:uncharacterized Zn finger protein